MEVPGNAAAQQGLFTHQQAVASSWTRRQLDRAVTNGSLIELVRGVYGEPADLDDVATQARAVHAVQLARPEGWCAARRSAAVLFELPLVGRPPKVPQLLRDQLPRSTRARDRHCRVAPLPADERVDVRGVRATSPARTVVDIAREEVLRNGLVVADAALRRGLDPAELRIVLERQRRWPGMALARQVVALADGRAESPGESVTRSACVLERLPVPEPQVEVWWYGEQVARTDLLFRDQLLVLESDGALKFTDARVLPDLLERQEWLRDCGLDVMRVGWEDVFRDTSRFGRRVRDRLAAGTHRTLAPGVRLVSTRVRVQGPPLPRPLRLDARAA